MSILQPRYEFYINESVKEIASTTTDSFTLQVFSSTSWEVSSDSQWIVCTRDGDMLIIAPTQNLGEARTATIYITNPYTDEVLKYIVMQAGAQS